MKTSRPGLGPDIAGLSGTGSALEEYPEALWAEPTGLTFSSAGQAEEQSKPKQLITPALPNPNKSCLELYSPSPRLQGARS